MFAALVPVILSFSSLLQPVSGDSSEVPYELTLTTVTLKDGKLIQLLQSRSKHQEPNGNALIVIGGSEPTDFFYSGYLAPLVDEGTVVLSFGDIGNTYSIEKGTFELNQIEFQMTYQERLSYFRELLNIVCTQILPNKNVAILGVSEGGDFAIRLLAEQNCLSAAFSASSGLLGVKQTAIYQVQQAASAFFDHFDSDNNDFISQEELDSMYFLKDGKAWLRVAIPPISESLTTENVSRHVFHLRATIERSHGPVQRADFVKYMEELASYPTDLHVLMYEEAAQSERNKFFESEDSSDFEYWAWIREESYQMRPTIELIPEINEPVYLYQGMQDRLVDPQGILKAQDLLQENVVTRIYPNNNHALITAISWLTVPRENIYRLVKYSQQHTELLEDIRKFFNP